AGSGRQARLLRIQQAARLHRQGRLLRRRQRDPLRLQEQQDDPREDRSRRRRAHRHEDQARRQDRADRHRLRSVNRRLPAFSGWSRRRRLPPARPLVAAAALVLPASWAAAQEAALSGGVLELDAITVTASEAGTGEPAVAPTYGALSPTSI